MERLPRLVYIPGMALTGQEFARAAQLVSAAGYPYVCVQRPGIATGQAPNWREGFSLTRERERVRSFLTAGCVVVAHSFGGFLVPVDARISAIIYLDASIPGQSQLVTPGVLWPLARPLMRPVWHLSAWAATGIYEDAAYNRGAQEAAATRHDCEKLVITAGTHGIWFRSQRAFARAIGARQVAIVGGHLLALERPEAVAAHAIELLERSRRRAAPGEGGKRG